MMDQLPAPDQGSDGRALVTREEHLPVVVDPHDGDDGVAAKPDARQSGARQENKDDKEVPRPPRARVLLYVLVPLALAIGYGAWAHWAENARAQDARTQMIDAVPELRTVVAKRDSKPIELVLPAQTEAFNYANLYARATGFIAERHVDIGSRVRRGDLLVRIAAPDLDQQLVQAAAQLGQVQASVLQAHSLVEQAQANTSLAKVTKFRETTLASQGWETKQNADNSTANASVQVANVDSAKAGVTVAEANFQAQLAQVQRLQALIAFERVTAPFDGVITARNVDVGDLVSADSASGSPAFTVQSDDVLRISVQVPQSGAVGLRDGLDASITVPELPGRTFHGTVARSSVALSPVNRSLTAEVDVPNSAHTLRPGLYVNVTFQIPRATPAVVIPSDALVFNSAGMQVAVVQHDKVHYRKVTIGRDFGQTVELSNGLDGGETIALDVPAGLDDGAKIKVQPHDENNSQGNGANQTASK